MLSNAHEILNHAYKNHYAVGAFNAFNLETIRAVIEAAEESNSPVILETSESEAAFGGIENVTALVKSMANRAKVPVILNFDHGKKFESIKRAIESGYTAIMIDASSLSLEENIFATKKVVEMAHAKNVLVEAEIGNIPTPGINSMEENKEQESDEFLTDVEEAKIFAKETGVDILAVAIGNKHGFYKGEPKINLERLKEIYDAVDTPLVLHGGSGIPYEYIKKAIKLGIVKINVNTELRVIYIEQLKKSLVADKLRKPYEIMREVVEAVKGVVKTKIELFKN